MTAHPWRRLIFRRRSSPRHAVFSKYAAVLEADGTPMSVRAALQLFIQSLPGEDRLRSRHSVLPALV